MTKIKIDSMQIVTRLSNGNRQSRKTQGMSLKTGFYQEKCGRLKFLPKRQGENMTDRSAINGQITLGHFTTQECIILLHFIYISLAAHTLSKE
jgi:hypothetical protein